VRKEREERGGGLLIRGTERRKRRKRTKGRGRETPESQGEQNKTLCEWAGGLT